MDMKYKSVTVKQSMNQVALSFFKRDAKHGMISTEIVSLSLSALSNFKPEIKSITISQTINISREITSA